MKKRILAILLLITLLTGLLPTTALADTTASQQLYLHDVWYDSWFSNLPAGDGWHGYFTFHAANESTEKLAMESYTFERTTGTTNVTVTLVATEDTTANGYDGPAYQANMYHIEVSGVGSGTLSVVAGGTTYTTTVTVNSDEPVPELLYSYNDTLPAPLSSFCADIDTNHQLQFHYGTTDSNTPLSGGTMTSSNPDVITVDDESEGYHHVYIAGTGTTVLTYTTTDNVQYSAIVTIPTSNSNGEGDQTNREVGLYFRYMDWDNANNCWTENLDAPFNSELNVPCGTGHAIKFYFYNGTGMTAVARDALTFPAFTTPSDEASHIQLNITGFGTGTISYTPDADGPTYEIPVTATLPEFGFYSTESAGANDFLSSFKVRDPETDAIYFVADKTAGEKKAEITSATLDEEFDAFADIEQISDTCWQITFTGAPQDERNYEVIYSGTDPWGNSFSDRSEWLEIGNGTPGLRYRNMQYDNGSWVENTDWALQNELSMSIDSVPSIKIYFFDGDELTPVAFSDLSFSDGLSATNQTSHIEVSASSFEDAGISYTTGGQTYTLPVTVTLPTFGFYSTQMPYTATYLQSFEVTDLAANVIYFVANTNEGDGTAKLSDVTLNGSFSEIAVAEKVTNTCWKISFTAAPSNRWYNLTYSGTDAWDRSFTDWGCGLELTNGIAGLLFRDMAYDPSTDSFYEDTDMFELMPLSSLYSCATQGAQLRFYYGTANACVAIDTVSITSGSSISMEARTASDNKPFWQLSYDALGDTTLSFKAGQETYTATLTVMLPAVALYSAQSRDGAHLLGNPLNCRDLTNNVAWVMRENGFTAEEIDNFHAEVSNEDHSASWEFVQRDDDNYDIKLTLSAPASLTNDGYDLSIWVGDHQLTSRWVINDFYGSSAYLDHYAIGFAFEDEQTGIVTISEGNWIIGNTSSAEPQDAFEFMRTIRLTAGIRKTDEQGSVYYEEVNDDAVSLQVNKLWLEDCAGTEGIFSLSENALVTELTNRSDLNATVYMKYGHVSTALLWAELDVTINGETETVKVSIVFNQTVVREFNVDRNDVEGGDTVEKLNAYLAELAETVESGTAVHITLDDTTYAGEIVIPSAFDTTAEEGGLDLTLTGSTSDGARTIVNYLHLKTGAALSRISDISFIGSDEYPVGIYGGTILNAYDCTFENYEIAIDASAGSVTFSDCLFVNNDLAFRVDIDNLNISMNRNPLTGNTFINNGTAVQVLSLNEFISSYHFRVINSNFINNGTDFDVQCDATLYMQKNYFGEYITTTAHPHRPTPGRHHADRHNGRDNLRLEELLGARSLSKLHSILKSRSAIVRIDADVTAKVIANPRWKHPVKSWWKKDNILVSDAVFGKEHPQNSALSLLELEEDYEDILISDWELETQIINDEASDMLIDNSSLDEETDGDKVITVVDREENKLGEWAF